jgi:hypothetical protein
MIQLCRLLGEGLSQQQPEILDLRVSQWIHGIPRWKLEAVDPNGAVDYVLFHSLALAHRYVKLND